MSAHGVSSTPTSSRLPAITAAEILQQLDDSILSSGSRSLDECLGGGFERGKVTEIWGPNGAGKTAIALAAARSVHKKKSKIVWAGCGTTLSSTRIAVSHDELSEHQLQYLRITSLSELLVLLKYSDDLDVFPTAGLLIVDDLNSLVDHDYPRQNSFTTSSDSEARKWQAGRRNMILATIVTALNRLASLHHLVVIVTNGCATSNRSGSGMGTGLVSAIGSVEWDAGIWNRLVVFQDFNGRFIYVRKAEGKHSSSIVPAVHFELSGNGMLVDDATVPTASARLAAADVVPSQTRKREYHEIADSEDEDEYDWNAFDTSDVMNQA